MISRINMFNSSVVCVFVVIIDRRIEISPRGVENGGITINIDPCGACSRYTSIISSIELISDGSWITCQHCAHSRVNASAKVYRRGCIIGHCCSRTVIHDCFSSSITIIFKDPCRFYHSMPNLCITLRSNLWLNTPLLHIIQLPMIGCGLSYPHLLATPLLLLFIIVLLAPFVFQSGYTRHAI
jgi:hypothetical protein